jgi:N-acyl homoserine lactone hydrolase
MCAVEVSSPEVSGPRGPLKLSFFRGMVVALALFGLSTEPAVVAGPIKPRVKLWRLDCGYFIATREPDACYLIRHGDSYMLWDAGLDADLIGQPPQERHHYQVKLSTTLVQQLALLGVKPADISIVAVSHMHFDHIGQAASFPHAVLMIGKGDYDVLASKPSDLSDRLEPWIKGDAPKEIISGDKDIFGDGTVVMIATPGHTPGHHSLLLHLEHTGAVMLTGDLYETDAQYRDDTVLPNTADVEATRSSFRRFKAMALRERATIVIPHEEADIGKLPAFPKAAD